jgi:hypothetical protein
VSFIGIANNIWRDIGGAGGGGSWVLAPGGVKATLDIDFVGGRAFLAPTSNPSISSLLTCTRATPAAAYYTSADGTLRTFAANTIRYGTNGLLVEEARTNLILQSQTLDTTWTLSGSTISADAILAPDGTLTADKIVESVGAAEHKISQGTTDSIATYTRFFYAKAGERSWVALRNVGGTQVANFNVSTGVVGTTTGIISASIEALANGWYRCIVVAASVVVETMTINLGDADTGTGATYSYTGNGTSGLYVWGAQTELGAFATSYIPTTTVSVTRALDLVRFSDVSWLLDATGTFYGQGTFPVAAISGGNRLWANDGANTPIYAFSGTRSGSFDGVINVVNTAGSGSWSAIAKAAMAHDAGGTATVMNAGAAATDVGNFSAAHSAGLGSDATGALSWNGYIRRVAYWNTRLSNGTLQTITT